MKTITDNNRYGSSLSLISWRMPLCEYSCRLPSTFVLIPVTGSSGLDRMRCGGEVSVLLVEEPPSREVSFSSLLVKAALFDPLISSKRAERNDEDQSRCPTMIWV